MELLIMAAFLLAYEIAFPNPFVVLSFSLMCVYATIMFTLNLNMLVEKGFTMCWYL
jgi:hypothetical protein